MKKLILAITTLALISTTAFAQDENMDRRDDLYLGAKVGGNYSNVYDTKGEEFDADPKIGLAFGAFISIPIGTYFVIQPEVMVSKKGFKGSGSGLGVNYEITRTTNYLDVPIYLQFKPSEFITFVAGPQYSYLLSRKDEFESDFGLIAQEEEFKNEDIRKNTLGASLGFDINLDNIVIGARAAWDLQDNKGDGTSSTPRYRNTLIQATIGLRF
jgi:hypothetical protein